MLAGMVRASTVEDGLRVSTHVLYPSNSAVAVTIRGGKEEFILSDDGGAMAEMSGAGLNVCLSDAMVNRRVRKYGLRFTDGAIFTPTVKLGAIAPAAVLLANVSRDVAAWGLTHFPFVKPRDFRKNLADLLGKYFHDNLTHDAPIVGQSNKAHKFTHVIYLEKNRKLLIDPAMNDAGSINARVVANLDVRMANNPFIDQLIVYDDSLKWKASDLKLLEVGAPTVAFSQAEPEIRRRAA